MQHIFITNPAAGQGKAESVFTAKIIETSKRLGIQYIVHRTMGVGDGERFIKKFISNRTDNDNEIYRFYACGGDGTLNEVLNGAFGAENIEIGLIPTGTGNDFVRNFKNVKNFLNVEKQIKGEPIDVDVIKYKSDVNIEYIEGDVGERYSINMINMGIDASIVYHAGELKKLPLISGSVAYLGGIAKSLVRKETANIKIEFDDYTEYEGNALLVAIGNGKYYGGGFQGTPLAVPDDGYLDVSIVRDLKRREIIPLISKYRKGTHLNIADAEDKVYYKKCKSLVLRNISQSSFCVDGEIKRGGDIQITLLPKSLKLSIPVL